MKAAPKVEIVARVLEDGEQVFDFFINDEYVDVFEDFKVADEFRQEILLGYEG